MARSQATDRTRTDTDVLARAPRFELLTLGRLALLDVDGREEPSLTARPRKLALLAWLALRPGRRATRDRLIGIFWGGRDADRARNSLSDAISHLRRVLGREAVLSRGDEVLLAEHASLVVDALEVVEAAAAGDHARVMALHVAPFLDGVYIDDAPEFDDWRERERSRQAALFARSAAARCNALARLRQWDECRAIAERWLDAEPASADAALFVLNAIKAPDTHEARAATIAAYEALVRRLDRALGVPPDAAVSTLAREVAARLAAEPAATLPSRVAVPTPIAVTTPEAALATPPAVAPTVPNAMDAHRPRRFRRTALVAGALAVAAIVIAGFVRAPWLGRRHVPTVALVGFAPSARRDSATWLADGLPQLVAERLRDATALDVVAPSRVATVLRRKGMAGDVLAQPVAIADLGRRVGADVTVMLAVVRDGRVMRLSMDVRDVASGRPLGQYTFAAGDESALSQVAAARLLRLVEPRVSETELASRIADPGTTNIDAFRAYAQAMSVGSMGNVTESIRLLDASIALDSSFGLAVVQRAEIASSTGDDKTLPRLLDVYRRYQARWPARARLQFESLLAKHEGDAAGSITAAQRFVERFPRDPNGWYMLADRYIGTANWADAERATVSAIALDSLGIEAGDGACVPCLGYSQLAAVQLSRGDYAGAERAARRLVALQPDAPGSWSMLAYLLAVRPAGAHDSALAYVSQAIMRGGGDHVLEVERARLLLIARRLASVDSIVAAWRTSGVASVRGDAAELQLALARERGQFRTAHRLFDTTPVLYERELHLVRVDGMARSGDVAGAWRTVEAMTHGSPPQPMRLPLEHGDSRAFAWHHAQLAEAIRAIADTTMLRALADSMQMIGAASPYARDWLLHHHVRGIVAERAGRWAEAEREFHAARYSRAGLVWVPPILGEARAQLAQGHAGAAIKTLRDAYTTYPDAMGWYVPRSEVDYQMATMFARAGEPDSARVYAGYVRAAWADADPNVRARLATLPDTGR